MNKENSISLDCTNLFEDAIGPEHGLSPAEFHACSEQTALYTEKIQERRGNDIGFMQLPYDERLSEDIHLKGSKIARSCKNFVVLGIGGSALGNITIKKALKHSFHNQISARQDTPSDDPPGIFVLDNIDPVLMKDFFDLMGDDLPQTVFNVITKSGATAETMSQFLYVRELLEATPGCNPAEQIVLTTDPDPRKSLLRQIGEKGGYTMLPIPENVGGRFSVLSAVGLLTASVAGCDIESLLAGAAAMDKRCSNAQLYENPAALYACGLFKHYQKGKPVSVLMPYSHNLDKFALWYCQLWAESLGKRDGLSKKDVFTGPTPIASTGVTDQHSVMQLFQDGPFDKVITFIEVNQCRQGSVPLCITEVEPELSYLSGKSFNNLFQAELAATRCALRDKERPNCTISMPEISEYTLGQLFMFFEYAVTYSGYLYGVNAFDQPGVELGKQYTYGLMGREGFTPPKLD